MLSDWYFCTCVGHDADITAAVMSILGVLRDQAPDQVRMGIALAELDRADIWTKVYAIPAVLRGLQAQELLDEDADVAKAQLALLASSASDSRAWTTLLDRVVGRGEATPLRNDFERCAELLLGAESPDVSITPYMDLPAHATVVLWLSALNLALAGTAAEEVVQLLKADANASHAVLAQALSNQFGRLPLLLAVKAQFEAGQSIDTERLEQIARAAGVADLEPDLVALTSSYRVKSLLKDKRALQSALLSPRPDAHFNVITPAVECVLHRLGMKPIDVEHDLQKACKMALCVKHITMTTIALELVSDRVFDAIAGRNTLGQPPFWIPFTGWPKPRYKTDQPIASLQMAGLSLALCRWLECEPGRELSPHLWFFLTHADDVMGCLHDGVSAPGKTLLQVASSVLVRVAGRYLPVPAVIAAIDVVSDERDWLRLKVRTAVRLTFWASNAYRRAVAGRPESSWLEASPTVCEFALRKWTQAKHLKNATSQKERVLAACIDVLLGRGDAARWQDLLTTQPGRWPDDPRELLLPLRHTEADWYRGEPYPVLDPEKPHLLPRFMLFVATERCAHHFEGSGHNPHAEWDTAFAAVPSPRLDTLLRLRLIDLIDLRDPPARPCFDDDRKFQIATAILDSDSPYEVDRVLECIFRDPTTNLADRMHDVLVARIEGERERSERRDQPNVVAVETDRRDAILVALSRLAILMVGPGKRADWKRRFMERRWLARQLLSPQIRQLGFSVEHHLGRQALSVDGIDALGWPWKVRGAVVDVKLQRATVLAETLASGDVQDNLFRGGHRAGRAQALLGLVVAVGEDDQGWYTTIETGRAQPVDLPTPGRPDWDEGDFVRVPVQWFANGAEPVVAPGAEIRKLTLTLKPGDLATVTVHFDKNQISSIEIIGVARRGLPTVSGSPLGWADPSCWSPAPDTTQFVGQAKWARYGKDGQWRPYIEDRLGLLAALDHTLEVKLAWSNQRHRTLSGELGWVFDASGGRRFGLARSDFAPESWAVLNASDGVADLSSERSSGRLVENMLVTLRARDDGLFKIGATDDSRLRWRELFESGDVVVVQRAGNEFFVEVPTDRRVGNCPSKIYSAGVSHYDFGNGQDIDALVIDWDPRQERLRVEKVPKNELSTRAQWPALCAQWLNLACNDELIAVDAWGNPDGDMLQIKTTKGFVIDVPAEEWWGWYPRLTPDRPRGGRVCYVSSVGDWWPLAGFSELAVNGGVGDDLAASRWNGSKGVLCSVPHFRRDGRWVATIWPSDGGTGPFAMEFTVAVPTTHEPWKRVWPKVGDQVLLSMGSGSLPLVTVMRRQVIARPVWIINTGTANAPPLGATAPVWYRGKRVAIELPGPGTLSISTDSACPDTELRGTIHYFNWDSQRARRPPMHRAVAKLDGQNSFFCGYTSEASLRRGSRQWEWAVNDELWPAPNGDPNQALLYRSFARARPSRDNEDAKYIEPGVLAEQSLESEIDRLVKERESVRIRVDRTPSRVMLTDQTLPRRDRSEQNNTIRVMLTDRTLPRRDRSEQNNTIPLAASDGPYVVGVERRPGEALLLREAGSLVASTRRVPSIKTVDAWIEAIKSPDLFGEGATVDVEVDLGHASLHYVGPEERDPLDGANYEGGLRYRFEWAPGRCLLLPSHCLTFNRARFESVADQLFFGDNIRRVCLRKMPPHQLGNLVIDVLEVGLVISDAHRLFRQARDLKVVHLLQVCRGKDGVAIESIEGLSDTSLVEATRFFSVHAKLSNEDAGARVSQALGDESKGSVHGRLDKQLYSSSHGQILAFEPVEMRLGAGGLHEGERVFLVAGEIRTTASGNDCLLHLTYPEHLINRPDDDITMPRRYFSGREDLLRRLLADNPEALVDQRLLVRVTSYRGGIGAAILDGNNRANVPTRDMVALLGWMRWLTQPPLVTVIQDDVHQRVVLEVRPGVFVAVRSEDLQCNVRRPMQFGSVLRLRHVTGTCVSAVLATPSDGDLIPDEGRLVTLLPMDDAGKRMGELNPLTMRQRMGGVAQAMFTCETLPNVSAPFDADAVQDADAVRGMVTRLRAEHPRPAWVRGIWIGDDRRFSVQPWAPCSDAAVLLSATLVAPSLRVWGDDNAAPCNVSWLQLTFVDEPAEVARQTSMTRPWRAHDTRTWRIGDGSIEWRIIGPATAGTSLLFAETFDPGLRLRYSRSNMLRFAFPLRELSAMLPSSDKEPWPVTIAAIRMQEKWLIVEVAPGRVHVLPLPLLVVQGDRSSNEIELSSLALDRFGVGDQLVICRAQGAATDVDRVRLLNWIPGPRSALGGTYMSLGIARVDEESQGTYLGRGLFTLTLPMAEPALVNTAPVVVGPDNMVLSASGRLRQIEGTGALLYINEAGQLALDGLSGYSCWPDEAYPWQSDPFGAGLFVFSGDRPAPPRPGPHLRAARGVVPVTIEAVDPGRSSVSFSRRLQYRLSEVTGACPVQVLGPLGGGECVLRLGHELRCAPLSVVVKGFPPGATPALVKAVAKALGDTSNMLWVQVEADGALKPGLGVSREPGQTGHYFVLDLVCAQEGGNRRVEGLLCECAVSRTLHWLPINRAAWADLTQGEEAVRNLFISSHASIRAQVQQDESISIVDHPLAQSEFLAARPGTYLVVRPTGLSTAGQVVLVRSASSGVVLAFTGTIDVDRGVTECRAMVRMRDRSAYHLHCEKLVPNKLWLDTVHNEEETVLVTQEICSILLRHDDSAPTAKDEARAMFGVLVRRAWRHWPVELLVWTVPPGPYGPWQQFSKLKQVLLGEVPPCRDAALELKAFCRRVELTQWRGGTDARLLAVTAAVHAALGEVSAASPEAMKGAWVSFELRQLAKLAPPGTTSNGRGLPRAVREGLTALLKRIKVQQRAPGGGELRWGPPLPELPAELL